MKKPVWVCGVSVAIAILASEGTVQARPHYNKVFRQTYKVEYAQSIDSVKCNYCHEGENRIAIATAAPC